MEQRTLQALKFLLLFLTAGSIASCTKIHVGDAPSLSIDDAYASAFYANLVSAGMSSTDAAVVSGYSGSSASSFAGNLFSLSVNAQASDTASKAKSSVSRAMKAVKDDEHFPNASKKQDAIEIITQAQFETIAELANEADVGAIINEVAVSLGSDLSETGLSGSDLETAIGRQGKGFAKGLIGSDVDSSIHAGIVGEFSKGVIGGLLNNPNLSPSSVELISALTGGLINEVGSGSGSGLTGPNKGQIIKEILHGVKTRINESSDLSDEDKEGFVNEIWDSATPAISELEDSTIVDTIEEGLFSTDAELHVISIYEPANDSSAGWTFDSNGDPIPPVHYDRPATVNIAAGTKPIVLVLSAYEGVDWKLTGAVSRVSKVILHGYYDQEVDSVDSSIVQSYSYESSTGYMYNLVSSWPTSVDENGAKAFLVNARVKTGTQLSSFQSEYQQNSFTVGDGSNSPPSLPALTFVRPWLYTDDGSAEVYDYAGAPSIVLNLSVAGEITESTVVRVWVENVTTSTSDIPAFDKTYTLAAGSNGVMVVIPFNQTGNESGDETFKIHVESPDSILNISKVVNGVIHGNGTGLGGSGGSSGGSSGTSNASIRSQYTSVSVDSVNNLATLNFSHTGLDPYACMNKNFSYEVVLDTTNSANAAFLSAHSSATNQWLNIAFSCPSAPVNSEDEFSSSANYSYPTGCSVISYSASSAPGGMMCF